MAGKEHRSTRLGVLGPAESGPTEPGERFIGRERELGEIRAAVDGASSGRGRLFLITGEPGIGKTWLADEVARHATERGMWVVWGRCWEGGGAPAYWPWIQVIRGIIAEPEAPGAWAFCRRGGARRPRS